MEKSSVTIEDYLELLYVMQRDGVAVVGARLAELLGVTPPTVTNTLKRMARDGLVTLSDAQGTTLTAAGLDAARTVTRRHMLSEWMLVRMLQVPWSQTHAEAHNIEHVVSERMEEQMRANLGDPHTCPHGNPLPGYEDSVAAWQPLGELARGAKAIVRRIHEMGEAAPEVLRFLEENGILPGAGVELVEILPFNQTLTLKVEGRPVSLGFGVVRYIFVEKTG